MNVHNLDGCAPTPLAHYLKALGVLRLVAEQADPQARGWWEGERFRLATSRSFDDLIVFFLDNYRPTPLLAPWNGASGFFKTWDEKAKRLRKSKNVDALEKLLSLDDRRWEEFRKSFGIAVGVMANVLKEVNVQELPKKERKNLLIVPKGEGPIFPVADKDSDKAKIQQSMMRFFPSQEFYRSVIVDMGEAAPAYPSLWGSGGNDGAMDFTARYFENLLQALVNTEKQITKAWLISALDATPSNDLLTGKKGKVGQFLPGGAGGANSTTGVGSQDDTLLNPWDYILMMEGAVLIVSHATRRLGATKQSRAAAPFAVSSQGAGYASAAQSDESARGEQWMPLWSQPLTLTELRRLLAEGRVQIGVRAAQEPLDLARAVARFGSARGITAFQRYGYIERNGQSNLAVPLGRFRVPEYSSNQLACLDDLDSWLGRLRRESRTKYAPTRLSIVERRLSDALFALTQHPDESLRWQSVLSAMADVEGVLRTGTGLRVGPIPRLRPEWVRAADDGSPTFRLALACALQAADFLQSHLPSDPVRRHWLPLNRNGFATSGSGSQARIQTDSGVVLAGRRGIDDAIALVQRRLVEAGQRGERRLPLTPARKAAAHPSDLARLIDREVDLDRTMQLARALMAIDARQWAANPCPAAPSPDNAYPDDAWLAVRLALLPWPLPDGRAIGADAAIIRRLTSGDIPSAVRAALQRLLAAGIKATVRIAAAGPQTARLWAAALAFPITRHTAADFLRRLDTNSLKEKTS